MGSGRLRYADAVKLLGGQTPEIKALDNLLGGALAVATGGGSEVALGLFDAKAEVIRLGHALTDKLHEKLRGLGRFDRTMRLQAAYGVLVVTAYFEAVDEILKTTGLEDPELTRDEQIALAGGERADGDWLGRLLVAPLPVPSPDRTHDDLRGLVLQWCADTTRRLLQFLSGLRVWELATPEVQREVRLLQSRFALLAVRRFDEAHLRLATEIPEFALWTGRLDTEARHRDLRRSLGGLERFLRRTASGSDPERHRADLARAYRAHLNEPVVEDGLGDVTFPSLADLYIDPSFRVKPAGPGDKPADEGWWDVAVRDDLADFLAAYFTTPQAAEAPLLVLGQPGAGKSALTRVLAARLPATDFLVVRVPLREVPADAGLQQQIEFVLDATIGRPVAWADLAATEDGAMPVILLDGFDELLQATGAHQSDFLKKVAAFQKREATMKRPVAVVVTSRVAVADRATLPEDTLVARLAGFDRPQVEQWLSTWNAVNAPHGRPPLTRASVERYPHLIEQPLLLLMLALYDAEEPLREDAGLELADLYERLMVRFAEREVRRLHASAPEDAVPGLIEEELRRLSVMAFAMFNRSRLWVTDDELDGDLAAFGLVPARRPAEDRRTPLTAAQEVVGRFFFLQRAQAIHDGRTRQAYEFLHATFGEYLVARLVARLVTGDSRDAVMLRSLIGYAPLFARETVPAILHTLLTAGDAVATREWLMPLLRQAMNRPDVPDLEYRPVDRRVDDWMALYSINLTLLVLACGEPLRAGQIFPEEREAPGFLSMAAGRWGAAMERSVWGGFLDVLTVRRVWDGDRRDTELVFGQPDRVEPVDPWWTHGGDGRSRSAPPGTLVTGFTTPEHAFKSLLLGGGIGSDMLRHALEPVLAAAPEALTTFVVHGDGTVLSSVLHDAVALWHKSATGAPDLTDAYDRAVRALAVVPGWSDFVTVGQLVLRLLRQDAGRFWAGEVVAWLQTVVGADWYSAELAPDVVECLAAAREAPDDLAAFIETALRMDITASAQWRPAARVRIVAALGHLRGQLSGKQVAWVCRELLPTLKADLREADVGRPTATAAEAARRAFDRG